MILLILACSVLMVGLITSAVNLKESRKIASRWCDVASLIQDVEILQAGSSSGGMKHLVLGDREVSLCGLVGTDELRNIDWLDGAACTRCIYELRKRARRG